MSALFGIIYKHDPSALAEDMTAMLAALAHRSVDGSGLWRSDSSFIGHCLLAVVPEQRAEQMPLEDGDLVIAADASLHNRTELFDKLSIERTKRNSYADSSLILDAFKKWGRACVDHLDGEYVFVVFDKVSRSLFCASDHIGFRPLFYHDTPGMFVFSSEMKGVMAVKKTPNVFNEDALIEYYYGQADKTKTYDKDVFALTGGNILELKEDKLSINRYWTPGVTEKYRFTRDNDWTDCLRELLFNAVENRLRTDKHVGLTLSGGLDSSTVACIASRVLQKRNQPLYAFSSVLPVGHQGVESDEREYIDILGLALPNLVQTYVEAPGKGPFTELEDAFRIEEGIPNAFFYMDHALNRAAADKGVKTLLSGFGGDFVVSWRGNPVVYQLLKQLELADAYRIFTETMRREKASFYQLLKTELVAHSDIYTLLSPLLRRGERNWKRQTTLHPDYFTNYSSGIVFKNDPDHKRFMRKYIAEGNMSRSIGTFVNRDAAFGMTTAMPLFDRHIMELMFDAPLRLFRVNGDRRSLVRAAMADILPPEIRLRTTKQSYSPDYITRLKNNKQFVNALVNGKEYNFVWRYIDKESIACNVDIIQPTAGMPRVSQASGVRIIQGVICGEFLKWLMINHYSFERH